MTFIRRKALEISSWVTWLASPGCKEWAEGLEREVAFIPSDWRALGWAIGSIRLVFDRRPAPITSIARVAAIAKDYRESYGNRWRPATPLICWAGAGFFLWSSLTSRIPFAPLARAGGLLVAASMIINGYLALVYRQRVTGQPTDAYEWVLYYRSALRKDFECTYGRASWLPNALQDSGMWLLFSFTSIDLPREFLISWSLFYLFGVVGGGMLIRSMRRRKLQWEIADLDALIARAAGVQSQ
jgi:hypothetical protein